MKNRPEYMILFAVLGAAVAFIICGAVSCGLVADAAAGSAGGSYQNIDDLIGRIDGGNGGSEIPNGPGMPDDSSQPEDSAQPVPESMDIDVAELQDDIQAVINSDIRTKLNLNDQEITVTGLTKDSTAKPELKNGTVLSEAHGTITVKNADGKTGDVGFTSYYYAEDPSAQKIVWYIYAYDLDSFSLMPGGLESVAGDPMNIRSYLQGDFSDVTAQIGRDNGGNAKTA